MHRHLVYQHKPGCFQRLWFCRGYPKHGQSVVCPVRRRRCRCRLYGVMTWVLLKLVDVLIGLRVTHEEEIQDLDFTMHEERGYDNL